MLDVSPFLSVSCHVCVRFLFFVLVCCFVFAKTLIERQNNVAEMAATRQVQEKRRQRQMAVAAARQVRMRSFSGLIFFGTYETRKMSKQTDNYSVGKPISGTEYL